MDVYRDLHHFKATAAFKVTALQLITVVAGIAPQPNLLRLAQTRHNAQDK
ncbi:MAG: hypothetical protein Q7S46_02285 [Gallionella sp.]|nr:hypothetical protein [Gallionella sp.]